jgi:WD40 repeat protein
MAECEAASTKEITGGGISGLVVSLVKSSPGSEGWRHTFDLYTYEIQSLDQVQALVCIDETYQQTATYDDGAPANRITWVARVVRWSSGELVDVSPALQGDRPPQSKTVAGPMNGSAPTGELIRWLAGVFSDQAIFVHEPYFYISNIAISPDGKTLVTDSLRDQRMTYSFESSAPAKNTIKVWDIASEELKYSIPVPDDGDIYTLAITPDGKTLLAFINNVGLGQITSWNLATGKSIKQLEIGPKGRSGYNNYGSIPVFSNDTRLFAIDYDQSVFIYNTASGALISSGKPAGDVRYMAFSPDNALVASTDLNELKVWQVASGKLQFSLPGSTMVFSPDGKELAVESLSDGRRGIEIVDSTTGAVKRALGMEEYKDSDILSMTYSPDGTILAVLSFSSLEGNGLLTLWNPLTPEKINAISNPGPGQGFLHQLVFSADGKNLAVNLITGDGTGYVKLISVKDVLGTGK